MSELIELFEDLEAARWNLHSMEGEDLWRGDGQSQHTIDAKEKLDRIEREIEEFCRWQPIETAPKDGTAFVGYWVFAVTDGIPQWEAGCALWENDRFRFRDAKRGAPTHWIPPPAAQQ